MSETVGDTGLWREQLDRAGLGTLGREPHAWDVMERERREKLAADHELTVAQVEAAERLGMDVEHYAALSRSGPTLTDYQRVRALLAERARARAEAEHALAVEHAQRDAAARGES